MDLKQIALVVGILLWPALAHAQPGPSGTGPESAMPVRCVNTAGTAFESCAGSSAAGTDVNITGVGGNAVTTTVPISATSLPLPTNAATSALQTTGNNSLSNIDAKINGILDTSAVIAIIRDSANPANGAAVSGTGALSVAGAVTVSDGAGALNVIVDSGTSVVTQGTGTNLHTVVDSGAVTVSDGAGALNVIVDSGTLTAVTTITNAVTVSQPTAASLNMTEASAASIRTAVEVIDNFISGSRGLVTEDNSALIKAALDTLNAAVSTAANQVTGNASIAVVASAVDTIGTSSPSTTMLIGGVDAVSNTASLVVTPAGLQVQARTAPSLPLFPCNAVRRTNCQPKGF